MSAAFGKLQAQVTALNAQLAQMVSLQNGVDPTGYQRMARAAAANDRAFRSAVASTGMFEQQQLRVNRATDDYIDALQRQKLSFREMVKQRKIAAAAYKEQLAMEQMMVRRSGQATANGRQMLDVTYPKAVSKEFDTAGRRLAYLNTQLKSGAHQMVNWGKNTQWAGRQLMVGFTLPILAAGAAAGVLAYQMDKEFTRIAKVYDTTADATSTNIKDMVAVEKELAMVREAGTATAIKAAKEYGQSATDTLKVQAELAATGKKGAELQKSTAEVMRIARLGEIDHQTAIEATIALQSTFKMSTEELTESFNYMNSVENATSLATADFAAAIPIASGPIKAFGGDIKELGILLTAMKEQGIGATEGANAIKASMQRLARPSKQIRQEFEELTGQNITEIVEGSSNLTEIFTKLNTITKDMGLEKQRKVFAGLFGSYQVARLMAVTKGMGDLQEGVGQVSAAYEISQQSASDWAATADREVQRYQKSISGRWDTAFQEMKIQLSTLGEPFVEMATVVVKGISKVISWFNKLPKAVKVATALGIGLAAIAGPVVMLAGLFANLAGNLLKGTAAMTGLIAKMNLGTTSQRASAMAAKMAEGGFISERTAVQQLTVELGKLAAAQAAANAATMAGAAAAGQRASANLSGAALMAATMASPYTNPHGQPMLSTSSWKGNNDAERERTRLANEQAKAQARSARNMKLMAASGAVAAASMVTMMSTTNETANNIAKWALIGAIVVPAFAQLAPLLTKALIPATILRNRMREAALAAQATGAGRVGMMSAAARAVASPIGLAATAAVVVTGLLVKGQLNAAKKAREVAKEQQKQINNQKALLNVTEDWAAASGETLKNYKAIKSFSGAELSEEQQNTYQKDYEYFTRGEGKNSAEAFGKNNETQQNAQMMLMFAEQTEKAGRSLEDTKASMLAFAVASGRSLSEANEYVDSLFVTIDKWGGKAKFGELLNQQMDLILKNLTSGESDQILAENGKNAAEIYVAALATGTKAQQKEISSALTNTLSAGSEAMYGEVRKMVEGASDTDKKRLSQMFDGELNKMLSSYDNFKAAMEDGEIFSKLNQFVQGTKSNDWDETTEFAEGLRDRIGEAARGTEAMNNGFLEQLKTLGRVNKDVKTLAEALRSPDLFQFVPKGEQDTIISKEINKLEVLKRASKRMQDSDILGIYSGAAGEEEIEKQKKALTDLINVANKSRGFAMGEDLETAMANLANEIPATKDEVEKLKKEAEDTAGQYTIGFHLTNDQVLTARKDAMQSIQEQIADGFREDLDSRNQAMMAARQSYWDNQQEAQDNAFQRQQDAMDAKWDRKKDKANQYWDNRVKAIQNAIAAEEKAEDKRQKMFDAEMDRISRLNEAMNRNIDFNVALNAGNFDEAAKIRNDVTADATKNALEAAAGAGATGSAKRVEGLEGRLDVVEAKRDKYMKGLEKREQAERRHLDKIQNMQKKSLDKRSSADLAALQRTQDAAKKSLDAQLDMFMAFLPKNQTMLRKHMANMGLDYDKFEAILRKKGTKWGDFYGNGMANSLRKSGLEMESDAMWARIGKKSSEQIVRGMGFKDMSQFELFLRTGKMGKGAKSAAAALAESRHEGGVVGSGGMGSRKGVARSLKGLHSSEKMIRAQKGEFVVNRKDSAKHRNVLENINNGKYGNDSTGGYGTGGMGTASLMAGVMGRGLIQGIAKSFKNAKEKSSAMGMATGMFGAGKAGKYGDRTFDGTQLKNAATIASVGSGMGMTTRDIMIGIMTAITESGLRNVNYGDRDSLGLFQQRPSQGWGTPAQVTDPQYAARKFFEGLKGIGNRNKMEPWLAAQAVQRSFDPTGGNYRQYWDEANAIIKDGLTRSKDGNYTAGGFVQGAGGRHRPVKRGGLTQGLHYNSAVDFGVPRGTAVFAAADGKVVSSRDIPGPLPTDRFRGDGPYGSYGRVIEINHGGFSTLYAHLSQRYAKAGQQVKGGSRIGLSGNTGNSSGPHLHFGSPGMSPYAFLKTGGTVKRDNTPAILHKDERVLTAPLTKKLDYAVDSIYRNAAGYGIGGPGRRKSVPYGAFSYPGMTAGAADSPYTNFQSGAIKDIYNSSAKASNPSGSSAKAGLRIGTLNTYVKTSAKATISDLARLTPNADFLALTEMSRKEGPIKKWLANHNWGAVGSGAGTKASSLMAYNKATQRLKRSGQRKLGDKMAQTVGGREKRYANYGLFTDKESGRDTWQVAAHTVPAARGLTSRNAPLYHEQWGNLNRLVEELQGTGAPVFVSGDLNVLKGKSNFQTPGSLNAYANKGVDYVFGDKKLSKLQKQWIVRGMHTDHGQSALMSQFSIPGMKVGGDVRWDNTIANLHKNERVLTAPLTAKLDRGLDNFANGGGPVYNYITVHGTQGMDEETLANKVIKKIERKEARKPQSRRDR